MSYFCAKANKLSENYGEWTHVKPGATSSKKLKNNNIAE